jgi:hypothetical protein
MKRLMTLAFAAAIIAGGVYAADVYDYKASVKNPNLKSVRVNCRGYTQIGGPVTLAVKYITTTSLYGYLVDECANCNEGLGNGSGYPVVANTRDKIPTILPADLLAKIWPANGCCLGNKSWTAEGYLFAGWGKVQQPWAAYAWDVASGHVGEPDYLTWWGQGDWGFPTAGLFGQYNRPDSSGSFADAWLDAAGFGLATSAVAGDLCGETSCTVLDSLAGQVIGGMFLCAQSPCETVLCIDWGFTSDVVSGDWSIKRNVKLQGVQPNTPNSLGNLAVDAFVNAAILKINSDYGFDDVVPSTDYTDGTISFDWPRY